MKLTGRVVTVVAWIFILLVMLRLFGRLRFSAAGFGDPLTWEEVAVTVFVGVAVGSVGIVAGQYLSERGRSARPSRPTGGVSERTHHITRHGRFSAALPFALQLAMVVTVAGGLWAMLATGVIGRLPALITASAIIAFGSLLYMQVKRRLARSAEETMAADTRPPVLYLRPFQHDPGMADRTGGRSVHPRTYDLTSEELLQQVFEGLGPLIAIGDPGDQLPRLGASRLYVEDDNWQEQVTAWMDVSSLVVLNVGSGDGFWWEFETAVSRVHPMKLLLLVPTLQRPDHSYDEFRRRANDVLPKPLPALSAFRRSRNHIMSLRGAIHFDVAWSPQVVDLHLTGWARWNRDAAVRRVRQALSPLLDHHEATGDLTARLAEDEGGASHVQSPDVTD